MSDTGKASFYDEQNRYVIDHRSDPAWPGRTPEPERDAVVAGEKVPAALSWIANAQPAHHALVAEMIRSLPERRLTRLVGHGDKSHSWMAINEGPDGSGSWLIPYDPSAADRAVVAARQSRSLLQRAREWVGRRAHAPRPSAPKGPHDGADGADGQFRVEIRPDGTRVYIAEGGQGGQGGRGPGGRGGHGGCGAQFPGGGR